MGGWSDGSHKSDDAEVKTDPATTQKKTAVKSDKQQITFYSKKQPTLSRRAKGPLVELPNEIKPETAKHMKVPVEELADAQEMEHLKGGLEEIVASKDATELDKLLKEVGFFGNTLFNDLNEKMTERTGSLEARLASLTSSPGDSTNRADARSAIEQARGRASQPTTDSNGSTWFETKSSDGKKSVLISPDRKQPGETGNGGTIIVVQHTDQGTTIDIFTSNEKEVNQTTIKCDDDGCVGVDPNAGEDTNQKGKTTPCTDEDDPDCTPANPGRPAPDDTGSGTPVTPAMAQEALAKFFAEHGGRPWNVNAGKPVPESDGDNAIDPVASRQLFDQLGRHKWNPRIVQPGPDGDNEREYLGMEGPPSNLVFLKMELTGQPVPDDPDWGAFHGTPGGSSGGSVDPHQVTTQTPTEADGSSGDEEVPEQDH